MTSHVTGRKRRVEDIPTQPLDDLVDVVLDDLNVCGFHDPISGLSMKDLYNFLQRQRFETQHVAESAQAFGDISEARRRLMEINRQLRCILNQLHQMAPAIMRAGRWVGFGRIGGRLRVIPRSDWTGELDWKMGTLTTDTRLYQDVRIMSNSMSPQDQAALSVLYDEANRDPAKAALEPARGPGRPSSKELIFERFAEMREAGELKPTVVGTAREISAWLAREHPDFPGANAKTVGKRISALYREAKSRENK